jgi:hypothetical protein
MYGTDFLSNELVQYYCIGIVFSFLVDICYIFDLRKEKNSQHTFVQPLVNVQPLGRSHSRSAPHQFDVAAPLLNFVAIYDYTLLFSASAAINLLILV